MTMPSGAGAHDVDLSGVEWRKSSHSGGEVDCVAVAFLSGGRVAVRHSRDPDGAVLIYTPGEWSAFIQGANAGEFD